MITKSAELPIEYVPITGPAVDALNRRKECDDGPPEHQVTAKARAHFRKYGPVNWSPEVLEKVYGPGLHLVERDQ